MLTRILFVVGLFLIAVGLAGMGTLLVLGQQRGPQDRVITVVSEPVEIIPTAFIPPNTPTLTEAAGATASPTATETAAPTASATSEPLPPTLTTVSTPVPTGVPTRAPSRTPTRVPTAPSTRLPAPSPTSVPVVAPTRTATATSEPPTWTPTVEPTSTESPTASSTATQTQTETATATATASDTATSTATDTITSTPTDTQTATATDTSTRTPTSTRTASPTPIAPTNTSTSTHTYTPTATRTPRQRVTDTPTPIPPPPRYGWELYQGAEQATYLVSARRYQSRPPIQAENVQDKKMISRVRIIMSSPESVGVGVSVPITISVVPSDTDSLSVRTAMKEYGVATLKASIGSPAFDIAPLEPQETQWLDQENIQWIWVVDAKEGGAQTLTASLWGRGKPEWSADTIEGQIWSAVILIQVQKQAESGFNLGNLDILSPLNTLFGAGLTIPFVIEQTRKRRARQRSAAEKAEGESVRSEE